jgi:hypothetical protein
MTDLTLTKIRFRNGKWEGQLDAPGLGGAKPDIQVRHLDQLVETAELSEGSSEGIWDLAITIPNYAIAEGVQTFLITDGGSDTQLGSFTLIAGEPAADDLRAEVELLRAELDMLKRAFRRHCLETM